MTAPTQFTAGHTCPSWCAEDLPSGAAEVLHCREMPGTWGTSTERLRVSLERQDDADGAGSPQLCVQYLPNGRVAHGTVELEIQDGAAFALTVLRLAAAAQCVAVTDLLEVMIAEERRGPCPTV